MFFFCFKSIIYLFFLRDSSVSEEGSEISFSSHSAPTLATVGGTAIPSASSSPVMTTAKMVRASPGGSISMEKDTQGLLVFLYLLSVLVFDIKLT